MAQISLPLASSGLLAPAPVSEQLGAEDRKRMMAPQEPIDASGPNPFTPFVRLDELKKYYVKTNRNYTIMFWFTLIFFLVYAFWMLVESGELWGQSSMLGFSLDSCYGGNGCLKNVSSSGPAAQVPIQTGLTGVLLTLFRNVFSLYSKRQQFRSELAFSQQNYYPMGMTSGFVRRLVTLYGWKTNLFWGGVCIAGLGLVSLAYGNAAWGISELCSSSQSSRWYSSWFSVTDYHQWMAVGGVLGIGTGLVTILLSNPILRLKIKKVLSIFGQNEYNMAPEIKERVFRINKRDKMFCCVVLCVVGLAIYIIFKRLIVTVFNKSLKRTKI
ncbi:hypothetical protein MSUIS_00560 [Mycoplasma suis KI3806]|uniref:Uncharacterized protein n=1 Tax=Mycoplasma suis (strain KI_3806) TaxID=708248 RepID=F0V2S7_MYCS3|nr:hypothetical protein [Mycoplasma suis]CBZ40149.1 hypothetical protein MSUIS_00560 [Mycoplasma suis KI3806]